MQRETDTDRDDDERDDTPPAPGPTDQGGKGGMATREVAPEIATAAPHD